MQRLAPFFYKFWRVSLRNRVNFKGVNYMEAVMAWYKIGNFAALSLALVFAACGGDSGSNASNGENHSGLLPTSSSSVEANDSNIGQGLSSSMDPVYSSSLKSMDVVKYTYTFETYEDLLDGYYLLKSGQKLFCNGGVLSSVDCLCARNSYSAYVQSTNQGFYCDLNMSTNKWEWREIHDGVWTRDDDGLAYKTFVDNRDGNTYSMALINGKIWMLEKLEYDTGENISCISSYDCVKRSSSCPKAGGTCTMSYDSTCTEAEIVTLNYFREYGYDEEYFPKKGPCYSEKNVRDNNVCPQGWHIPDTMGIAVGINSSPFPDYWWSFWTSTCNSMGECYVVGGGSNTLGKGHYFLQPHSVSDTIGKGTLNTIIYAINNYSRGNEVRCVKNDNIW